MNNDPQQQTPKKDLKRHLRKNGDELEFEKLKIPEKPTSTTKGSAGGPGVEPPFA